MYKVFIDNKILILVEPTTRDKYHSNFGIIEKEIFTFDELISSLNTEQFGLIASTTTLEKTWSNFCNAFNILEAAGGIVKNNQDNLLMIYRLGKWDLPKGKIEKGETPQRAAAREVCEETGVCDIKIINPEPYQMYHTYTYKGKPILKRTFWYNMYCNNFSRFKIQTEEDITDAKWMSRREVDFALSNSYNSIRDLLETAFKS